MLTLAQTSAELVSKLNLSFTPDDWQVHLISRIRQGYNSVFLAGTGYGKSLVFEGLQVAVLGGQSKMVIIISPLKALERDQVHCLNVVADND
jgi:superfamily II DNA helicase RecQ